MRGNAMQLEIYRATMHCTYPDEAMWYYYAFQPIEAIEEVLDGHLICWTDESGLKPYAIVDIPDDTRVIRDDDGWHLQIADCHGPIDAEVVYELAVDHSFGMSVIQCCRTETQRYYWAH
jgi:hypothetical protein